MAIVPKWMLRLAGGGAARERRLAETSRAQERSELRKAHAQDETHFRARTEELNRMPHIILGTTASGEPYRIALGDLTSLPIWATAATGAGKSRLIGAMMESVISHGVRGAPVSLVLVDGKGETADQTLRSHARIVQTLPAAERRAVLGRTHAFRFFANDFLPSWPLLARVPGVPIEAQADAVAEVLNDVVSDATIGPRQRSTLAAMFALAIEAGIPLVELPWLLNAPAEIAALAGRSSLPAVRLELSRFEREPQGSIDGIVARLGIFLRVPSLKAALTGPRRADFGACFEPGAVTVLDFGGADLGARAAVRAMGSLAISNLANAAFDPRRTVRGTTMIVVDEPQALMTSVTLGQFERLVTLGRSFGAGGLVVVHQGATQLPAELQNVLNTNVALRIIGRSSERDAAASSEWLPRTGTMPRPPGRGARGAGSAFLSESEEERARIAEIGRLRPRHFLVADRRTDFAPRIIQAPEYDPPPWSAIDPGIAEAVLRGSAGVSRVELEARVREIEEQAATKLEARREAEGSGHGRRRSPTPPATPDVVGRPRGRGRRGEVP